MIVGLGLDVVAIDRIARAMRRPGFVDRILTPAERLVIIKPHRVAGRWAAKEAIAKAVGRDLRWQDIEILPGPKGDPVATLRGDAAPGCQLHLSITHERGCAAAVAVLERST